MSSLAIVIPAYKAEFLGAALESLVAQTNKDFKVYVGDDASPEGIGDIVAGFSDKLDIEYHRFTENLGGKNLIGQWERCVELCSDEEWVWLFSDDDVMQENCVEEFYKCEKSGVDIVHFNINIIDKKGQLAQECPAFPDGMKSGEFFEALFRRQIVARMPEFVFRREFLMDKGFVNFDLAWRSDTASVMSAALAGGIKSIDGARVLWRASDANISALTSLMKRKNVVNVQFFNWADAFFKENGISLGMSRAYLLKTIVFALEYRGLGGFLSDGTSAALQLTFAKNIWYKLLTFMFVLYRIPYRFFELRR